MRAVQFSEYGGPEVLRVVQVDPPHPGAGEIRIAVHAAGVNGIDGKIRDGQLREMVPLTFPAGTGLDAAGVVDEIGAEVDGVAIGDAVFGTGRATYADHAILTDWAAKPAALGFAEAAGFPIAVATAHRILDLAGVTAGQTILVSGASGGVGSATVQVALVRGAHVVGTAGPANQDYVRRLGATPTTYGPGLVERVRALAPDGVDAAFDIAGSGVIPELIELAGDPHAVVSIADFSAGEHGAQVSGGGGDRRAALVEAARLFAAGQLRLPVAHTFPLDRAGDAQSLNAQGHVAGRTVLVVT